MFAKIISQFFSKRPPGATGRPPVRSGWIGQNIWLLAVIAAVAFVLALGWER